VSPSFSPHATGVDLLDRYLGGLSRGRAYFVFGDTGTGKSLLGIQFLIAGLERGEPGLLVTHERPRELLMQAEPLGGDLEEHVAAGRLVILEYARDVSEQVARAGFPAFIAALGALPEAKRIRRAVFDPVHPLLAGAAEEPRLREDLGDLVDALDAWRWTSLLMSHDEGVRHHPAIQRVFLETCAGALELETEAVEDVARYWLRIHKLRHWTAPRRRAPYGFERGRGIVPVAPSRPAASRPSPRLPARDEVTAMA
jgi:circadian clock protein KaiC